jgi:hypothetical protein
MSPLSFFEPGIVSTQHFPLGVVFLDLLLAFVLSTGVATLYVQTHRGLSYSRNMVHTLVLLCLIVTMVMLVVGDSIARAFGLVGALAIVRFRTVVRDARDTTFIFLALSVGIAVGAQQYAVAILGTLFIGGVAVLLQASGFAVRHADTGVLRVKGTGGFAAAIDGVLSEWCRTSQLIAMREGAKDEPAEYSYEIRMFNPAEREELLRAVRGIDGATHASVSIEEAAEEW